MRLVLFSDLHLDATFTWAPREIARRRRNNIRTALSNIVRLAEEVDADAILSAGDLYEHEHITPDTAAFLRSTFAGTDRPVILVAGNHDPLLAGSVYAAQDWSDNVAVVTSASLEAVDLADGFRLWCASHLRTSGTDGFLTGFRVDGDAVHYALFHGSEDLGIDAEGDRKIPHAPFREQQVPDSGLAHALVGHFHTPRDGPWHTYPGNPDPLTFGETGERGAVVVDVEQDGSPSRTRHRVAVSQVADIELDVTGAASMDDVLAIARERLDGMEGEVRVTVSGEVDRHLDLQPGDLAALATPSLHVVPRVGRLDVAADLSALRDEATVTGEFIRSVEADDRLDDEERRKVLLAGLRALEGRGDLEVA